MLIQLHEAGTGLIEIVPSLPGAPQLSKLIPTQSFTATGDNAHGAFEFFAGHGFYFTHSKYHANRFAQWSATALERVIELRFMLGRPLRGKWYGIARPELLRHQFALCHTRDIDTCVDFEPADDYETLDVHYELEYLQELAPDFPLLDAFVTEVHRGNAMEASAVKHYCTLEMERIIGHLLNNPFDALRQKYTLERAACDLLLEALFEIHEIRSCDAKVTLTPFEIEVIYGVKKKIENDDFAVPLNALLVNCGMNTHKLNAGFIRFFKTTPYKYHMWHKMNVAVFKLLHTTDSISQIAYSLNYSLPNNFTLEFTKRFKCPPVEYRRRHSR